MAYRAVFSDIDGTLLNSHNNISQKTVESVHRLNERHIPFILVSARMPQGIFPLQHILGVKAPVICYSGALVLDEEGNTLFESGIDKDDFVNITSYISEQCRDICCSFYSGRDWFTANKNNPCIMEESCIVGIEPESYGSGSIPEIKAVHKLLCIGPPEKINLLENVLKSGYPFLNIYKSKDTYLEIISGKSSKSAAIKLLQGKLGVTQDELIAFGDQFNDIDMLKYAGLGIAMGNAPEAVKVSADAVTETNDSGGVAKALDFYFS